VRAKPEHDARFGKILRRSLRTLGGQKNPGGLQPASNGGSITVALTGRTGKRSCGRQARDGRVSSGVEVNGTLPVGHPVALSAFLNMNDLSLAVHLPGSGRAALIQGNIQRWP